MHWNLDTAHADVEFSVKHLMISTVKGHFRTFTGTGETAPDGTLTSVGMTIETASLDTNAQQRDDHLRSADFFDAAKFPKITFASTSVTQHGSEVTILGALTIRGAAHPMTLTGEYTAPAKDPWGNQRNALAVTGMINRKDWGLVWNQFLEAGGVAVGEEVKLRIEAEAVAVAVAAPIAA